MMNPREGFEATRLFGAPSAWLLTLLGLAVLLSYAPPQALAQEELTYTDYRTLSRTNRFLQPSDSTHSIRPGRGIATACTGRLEAKYRRLARKRRQTTGLHPDYQQRQ